MKVQNQGTSRMGDESKPKWMEEAERAGWRPDDQPDPEPEPEPPWMQEARAAGWNPDQPTQVAAASVPPVFPAVEPQPEPPWMQEARAAGWFPNGGGAGAPAQQPMPMPMAMAMAPPAGPPAPPAAPPGGQEPSRSRRGWVIAGSVAAAALILGIGAAVLLAVTGGDKSAKLVAPPTQTKASTPTTTTVIVKERTKTTKKKSSSNGGGSSSSGGSYNPPASTVTPNAGASNAVAGVQIKTMLNSHFQKLVDENYQSSYDDLTGRLATGASSWIAAQRQDGLYSFDLSVSPSVSGSSATATINGFTTRAQDSGCHTWSGSWGLVKVGGTWKISQSNLVRGSC